MLVTGDERDICADLGGWISDFRLYFTGSSSRMIVESRDVAAVCVGGAHVS